MLLYIDSNNCITNSSFYKRFAQDTIKFAERFSGGRLISVLEGGYSDRALTSGAMAHLIGLVDPVGVDESWWSLNNLIEVSHSCSPRDDYMPTTAFSPAGKGSEEETGWQGISAERPGALDRSYIGGLCIYRLVPHGRTNYVFARIRSAIISHTP